jgi:hypothetical protein
MLSLINMQDATASVYALKVEGMDEPLGIDFATAFQLEDGAQ